MIRNTNFTKNHRMKKTTTLVAACLMCITSLFGQDLTEFERIYYSTPDPIDSDGFTLSAKNAVAQADHCKFALKIDNTSNDYLIVNLKESTFNFSFGEKHDAMKEFIIEPTKSKTKTVKADGGDQFRQSDFSFEVAGISRVSTNGEKTEVEDFKLPPAVNSFTAGNFEVAMRGYDASTREAKAQFEVTYVGDDMGIVNPANLSVRATHRKTGDDVVYANDNKKAATELMRKGDKVKFDAVFHIEGRIVDMQFATMYIIWNDTFTESKAEAVDAETFEFTIDEALTREKK